MTWGGFGLSFFKIMWSIHCNECVVGILSLYIVLTWYALFWKNSIINVFFLILLFQVRTEHCPLDINDIILRFPTEVSQ